jgi:hypothetical protein
VEKYREKEGSMEEIFEEVYKEYGIKYEIL